MIQLLQENRRPRQPKFSERLLSGLGSLSSEATSQVPRMLMARQEDKAIQRLTGKDLSGLSPELKKSFAERLAKTPGHDVIVKSLVKKGVAPDDAELYAHLTTGGQTAFVKDLLEAEKRKKKTPSFRGAIEEETSEEGIPEKPLTPEQRVERELSQEIDSQDEGLTPAERVRREKERYDTGLKNYQESGTKLRGLERDKERLAILDKLNGSKKLPENFGRVNVTGEGNLRFPFASSPEAQQFVKTLNEFSAGAKDTYGSRVTNFDLQQYMLRYPNLLNSAEGRRRVIQQMKIVNEINSVYYKNLKKVYDEAGGVRKIDGDRAERFAEKLSEPKVAELTKKFDEIGQFPSLPNATEFRGKKMRNRETGEVMVSDGQNWIPGE